MLRVVSQMTTLTQCRKIRTLTICFVVIQMRYCQHYFDRPVREIERVNPFGSLGYLINRDKLSRLNIPVTIRAVRYTAELALVAIPLPDAQ